MPRLYGTFFLTPQQCLTFLLDPHKHDLFLNLPTISGLEIISVLNLGSMGAGALSPFS
jgi:hypothetical protein